MSKSEKEIVCRSCHEEVPVDRECPYCGTSVRNDRPLVAAIVVGVLMVGASLFDLGQLLFFLVVGVAVIAAAGYLLYDKRRRIDEATTTEEDLFGSSDESNDESVGQ